MLKLKKGQRVWWKDPAGETSGHYTIESDVQKDIEEYRALGSNDKEILSDLIILISNESGSEAQVYARELEPLYEGTYGGLVDREGELRRDMLAFILQHLRQNGGRISLKMPETPEDWAAFEFPATTTLYGRHSNDSIDITDVYVEPDYSTIYADGQLNGHGDMMRCYQIHPEHYSDVVWFISCVLTQPNVEQ